jgi:transketolase
VKQKSILRSLLMSKAPELLGSSGDSLREACGKKITEIAHKYPKLIVLDADIAGGTGMHHFRDKYPDKFIQCGIAEQNMMAMAGGLAATGLLPIVTTFAVFMLRAIEQARLSIAYPNLNVKIIASHPGLDVGPDGASAQCLEDLACYRSIPNFTVLSPCDPQEVQQATEAILNHKGPVYMRTGRSDSQKILEDGYQFEIGKARIIKEGNDLTIFSCGVTTGRALNASRLLAERGVSARVVNMSTIKPIDNDMIVKCAKETKGFITAEDHNIFGGLGSAIAESVVQHSIIPMAFVGVKDVFGESGEPDELAKKYQIDEDSIYRACLNLLENI